MYFFSIDLYEAFSSINFYSKVNTFSFRVCLFILNAERLLTTWLRVFYPGIDLLRILKFQYSKRVVLLDIIGAIILLIKQF